MIRKGTNLELLRARVPRQFGGLLLKGNAKVARPLSTKHAIHLVLKSEIAHGSNSLLHRRNAARVGALVRAQAKACGVRLYHFVNVGNHLHLVLKLERSSLPAARQAFRAFVRAVTGLIARLVLGAERGRAKGVKFWQARPFSRIIAWGRDYRHVTGYMAKNARQGFTDWGFGVTDPGKIARLDTG